MKRVWKFRLFALGSPFIIFGALELALQVLWSPSVENSNALGWELGVVPIHSEERDLTLEVGSMTVKSPKHLVESGLMHKVEFSIKPAPDTPRIFCLGGSVTLGFPFIDSPNLAFPSQLEDSLSEMGMTSEVINLGGASFGSKQVVELVEQIISYGPSAVVVYSANNEFFNHHLQLYENHMNDEILKKKSQPKTLMGLKALLKSLGFLKAQKQSPQELVFAQRDFLSDALSRDVGAVEKNPQGYIQRTDVHFNETVQAYERNLRTIRQITQSVVPPIPLIIVDPPQHLLSAPGLSLHEKGVDETLWMEQYEGAQQAAANADWGAAFTKFNELIVQDPLYAQSYFERGLVNLELGNTGEGTLDLHNALALDMDLSRPVHPFKAIIKTLGEEEGIFRIPLPQFTDLKSERELFYDPCHLTEYGYQIVGKQIAKDIFSVLNPTEKAPEPFHQTGQETDQP